MAGGGSQTINFKEGDAFLTMLSNDPFMKGIREEIKNQMSLFLENPTPGNLPNGPIAHDYGYNKGQPDSLSAARDALYGGCLYAPPFLRAAGAASATAGTVLGMGYGSTMGALISTACNAFASVGELGRKVLPLCGATKTSALLGRYDGNWQVENVDPVGRTYTVRFEVRDFWNAESLTSFLGSRPWLSNSPLGESGPLGGTMNFNFTWREQVPF